MTEQTFYDVALQHLHDGDFDGLAELCEAREIQDGGVLGKHSELLYCVELVALYLKEDLLNARFVWKRIPQKLKDKSRELAAVWEVGQAAWTKERAQMFAVMGKFNWSNSLAPFMATYSEFARQEVLKLVAKTYSSITTENFAHMLGIVNKTAEELALESGWRVDSTAKCIYPKQPDVTPDLTTTREHLKQLTKYAAELEDVRE